MARGQRKSIEEKIAAKQEIVDALCSKLENEKKELQDLFREKRKREMDSVGVLIAESGLSPDEVGRMLKEYLDKKEAC